LHPTQLETTCEETSPGHLTDKPNCICMQYIDISMCETKYIETCSILKWEFLICCFSE